MDVKKWQTLLAAVKLGSISRAAEQLGYTQSGVTYMMRSMEEELGFALLKRSWDGVSLTEEGNALLPAIRALVESDAALCAQIEQLNKSRRKRLCIGAYASISSHWLSRVLSRFHTAQPDTDLEVRIGSREELLRWLDEDVVAFTLADRLEVKDAEWLPLYHDPVLAVLPPDHPAAQEEVIAISELRELPFLVPSASTLGCTAQEDGLAQHGGIRIDSEDDMVFISMVSNGVGMSLLSELSLRGRREGLAVRALTPPMERLLGVSRKKRAYSAAERTLLSLLKENLPQ